METRINDMWKKEINENYEKITYEKNKNYEKICVVWKLKMWHVTINYHYLLGYSCETRVLHELIKQKL